LIVIQAMNPAAAAAAAKDTAICLVLFFNGFLLFVFASYRGVKSYQAPRRLQYQEGRALSCFREHLVRAGSRPAPGRFGRQRQTHDQPERSCLCHSSAASQEPQSGQINFAGAGIAAVPDATWPHFRRSPRRKSKNKLF
jgi:hypothetical protein